MNQEQFELKLREMFMPESGDPEYKRKETEATNLIQAAIHDTRQVSGGTWKDDIAAERFKQWKWLHNKTQNPEPANMPQTSTLPESTLHDMYKDYLEERGYLASKIPEKNGKRTPDFLVEGSDLKFLNEFKAPELKFNEELGVYKFQTTHSKILSFISKAVKQLEAEDPDHRTPWIVTFASTHFQLSWKSFIDTMQGGVAFDDKLLPDFTNTDMFKRVIKKAEEIDLYIWLQVNPTNEYVYQVSFIPNKDSQFVDAIEQFITDVKIKDVSNMDNVISIDWHVQ